MGTWLAWGGTMEMQRDDEGAAISPVVKVAIGAVTVGLVVWFLVAWLILDRHVLDAAGESVGTAFALGVIVSLVGALRRSG